MSAKRPKKTDPVPSPAVRRRYEADTRIRMAQEQIMFAGTLLAIDAPADPVMVLELTKALNALDVARAAFSRCFPAFDVLGSHCDLRPGDVVIRAPGLDRTVKEKLMPLDDESVSDTWVKPAPPGIEAPMASATGRKRKAKR